LEGYARASSRGGISELQFASRFLHSAELKWRQPNAVVQRAMRRRTN
jgi:hypothetical protein